MIEIGKSARLIIVRGSDHGFYLDGENLGEWLLPDRYVPDGVEQGDELDVFVYPDSEDRLIATTEKPLCEADRFGVFQVVDVNPKVGAFLDWGLPKDLLMPYREQVLPVQLGQTVVARVVVDPVTNRMIASRKLDRYLRDTFPTYREGAAVNLLVWRKTPLGFNVIVDGVHSGLLYHTDLAEPLRVGQATRGYVREIREGGRIDVGLQPDGYERVKPLTEQILAALDANDGTLELGDKSSPSAVREAFGTSKKAFKQALGALYKKRRISIAPTSIERL